MLTLSSKYAKCNKILKKAILQKGDYMEIILVAHGELAVEFLNTVKMIVGEVNHFHTISFLPGEGPDDVKSKILSVIDNNTDSNFIIFSDLFGGTPFNVSAQIAAENNKVTAISGMNLPMILELAFPASDDILELEEKVVESAKEGIKVFKL